MSRFGNLDAFFCEERHIVVVVDLCLSEVGALGEKAIP